MVEHHVGAAKNTDINRELTNCNKMLIKEIFVKNPGFIYKPRIDTGDGWLI